VDCIFCKIAAGTLPAREFYRDDELLAIADIDPQAPLHLLVMPVKHYANIVELIDAGESALAARWLALASKLGAEGGGGAGFRLVVNTGANGGQTVDHLHLHVLAERALGWPPG
jgi:histidine triad (HIT) family protein